MYISHMRSEGNRLLEAIDELIDISREARLPAEIYHLKGGWQGQLAQARRSSPRSKPPGPPARGSPPTCTPTRPATGLDAAMPPWVQEGGPEDPGSSGCATRPRGSGCRRDAHADRQWENLLLAAGSPEKVLLVGFKNPALKHLTGKTLAEVAARRGTSPEETAMDLVVEDGSRVDTVYFLMSEDNVRKKIRLPWVSFGSDAASIAPEGLFLNPQPHPRAYGNFARLLGKYVRDEKIIPLEEAIRKLSGLPAENLGLSDRGLLREGYFADVVVFDPAKIPDHATYAQPHQYATGMAHVFVNGAQVLSATANTPARSRAGPCGAGERGETMGPRASGAAAASLGLRCLRSTARALGDVLGVEVPNLGRRGRLARTQPCPFPICFRRPGPAVRYRGSASRQT